MDWLLGLPNTTSKVLDLPSGKSFFLLFFCESFFLIGCIEMEFQILLWATGGPLLAFHVVLLH